MRKMKELHVQLMFILTALVVHGIHGQVTVPPSTTVALGDDVTLRCTSTETDPIFTWTYVTASQALYQGTIRSTNLQRYANIVLQEGTDAQTSILNINAIEQEDDGNYRCGITTETVLADITNVTVEVASPPEPIELINIDNFANYQATCDAIGSKPEETITWILDGVTQAPSAAIVETDPGTSSDPLSDKRSVFTFPATLENYNVMLVCEIGGHQVSSLDRSESRSVNVQNPPVSEGIMVGFNTNSARTELTVTCNINDAVEAAIPAMDKFYIYSNGTLIPKSVDSIDFVTVTEPEQETEYTCVAGNYLGNTTSTNSYDPTRTTTLPPTTEPITTEGSTTKESSAPESTTPVSSQQPIGSQTGDGGLTAGAIAGIAVGAILVIIIIIVLIIVFVLKPDCVKGLGSSSGGGSSKKHGSSSVGSSNGNEKDKFKPTPTPRVQSSMIKHTNENPEHTEYAMVDRKPKPGSGGDMPDTRGNGAGQNEPPGMLYADLDLTAKAGHTEREVPQNPENVVVYSSILV